MAGHTKSSKEGRNSIECTRYRNQATFEKNQLKKMIRHCKRFGFIDLHGGFAPDKMGGHITACWNKLNAKLSNTQIKSICDELHVSHI